MPRWHDKYLSAIFDNLDRQVEPERFGKHILRESTAEALFGKRWILDAELGFRIPVERRRLA